MDYLIASVAIVVLAIAFVQVYGRRVYNFRGPWIIEPPLPPQSGRLAYTRHRGRLLLVGLTIEETREFEKLDRLHPLDESAQPIEWQYGAAEASTRETRWLELYLKHQEAKKAGSVTAHPSDRQSE
jgi:hypothetical protein